MNLRSPWLKHGFWNALEQGLTRVADAATSLILLWALTPESFSKLAVAQAIAAPLLFLFIAPEWVLYRDFAKWKQLGATDLASRIHSLRRFAWGKAQFAVLLSAGVAAFSGHWSDRFWSLIWAFSLVLAPQISGPDREFLRMDLELQTLNAISLFQKASLLIGTVLVAFLLPGNLMALALVAAAAALTTAWISRAAAVRHLRASGASEDGLKGRVGPSIVQVLSESIVGFSIWQHLNGIVLGWVQTMDLFFLGVFRFPAREVGLYAAVLKIANFSIAIPHALSNTISIWVGRRESDVAGIEHEKKHLFRVSALLLTVIVGQGLILYFLSPWYLKLLSHGRWVLDEQARMKGWLKWILIGSSLFAAGWPLSLWLIVRGNIRKLFLGVYVVWAIFAAVIYVVAIQMRGFEGAALANVFVSTVYLILMFLYLRKFTKTNAPR